MRLRVALRKLRHSARLSADDERELLQHCLTVEELGVADFTILGRKTGLLPNGLARLSLELCTALKPQHVTGNEGHQRRLDCDALLPTGLKPLNDLLGGGLATGEVTELVGAPCVGKTQLCLLACAAQLAQPEGGAVHYIDTSGGCCAQRLYQLVRAAPSAPAGGGSSRPLSREASLARLHEDVSVEATTTLPELLHALDALDARLRAAAAAAAAPTPLGGGSGGGAPSVVEGGVGGGGDGADAVAGRRRALRLLIVDSVYAALAPCHSDKVDAGAQPAMQCRLQLLLRDLATRHRLAVLVTNGCSAQHPGEPYGGQAWRFATRFAQLRLLMRHAPPERVPPDLAAEQGGEGGNCAAIVQVTAAPWEGRVDHAKLAAGGHPDDPSAVAVCVAFSAASGRVAAKTLLRRA